MSGGGRAGATEVEVGALFWSSRWLGVSDELGVTREVQRSQGEGDDAPDPEVTAHLQLREAGNGLQEAEDLLDAHSTADADWISSLVVTKAGQCVGPVVSNCEVRS